MSVAHETKEFFNLLKRLSTASAELLMVIEKERTMLDQQDPQALDAFSVIRTEKLTQFESAQDAIFVVLNVTDPAEFKLKLEKQLQLLPMDEQSKATTLWQGVAHCLKKCSEMNKVNGTLVQKNLQLLRRKIDILTQRHESTTYDEKGGL